MRTTCCCCYHTVRVVLSKVRVQSARISFCLSKACGGKKLFRFSSKKAERRSPWKGVAKGTLVSWGIAGISRNGSCEAVPSKVAQRKVDLHKKDALLQPVWLIFSVTLRACVLLLKFGPFLLLYPFTYLSGRFASLWFHLLLKVTESSGPTLIKLGQWASTRRDLFSDEFCAKFSKLHIQVIPHPWLYTERSLEKAFGPDWATIFTFESQEPVGSGCVAQVYKAYVDVSALGQPVLKERSKNSGLDSAWQVMGLKGLLRRLWWRNHDDVSEMHGGHWWGLKNVFHGGINQNLGFGYPGTDLSSPKRDQLPVAIKVLHPGLVQQVEMDLFLMKIGSRLIEFFPGVKWLSLTEIVEEFEKLMIQQIDLRHEARNLEHFRLNFQEVDYVKFPIPLQPYVSRNVLVETFEESKPVSQYLHAETTMDLRRKLAKMGIDMLLKMVFVDNFVHADLHPGNILVQGAEHFNDYHEDRAAMVDLLDTLVLEVQPSPSPLQLVLLDAGIIAELQDTDLDNLKAVFTAVILGQGERVAELILHHSRANQCKDVERFKADMAELVTKARNNIVALGKLQVGSLLSNVFKLLMVHQVKLESNFASVIFAIMVLEGLGRSLDPDLDLLKAAKPLLIKHPGSPPTRE